LAIGKSAVSNTWPIPVGEGGFVGEALYDPVENIVPNIVLEIGLEQLARNLLATLVGCLVGTPSQLLIVTNRFPLPTGVGLELYVMTSTMKRGKAFTERTCVASNPLRT